MGNAAQKQNALYANMNEWGIYINSNGTVGLEKGQQQQQQQSPFNHGIAKLYTRISLCGCC